MQIRMYRFRLYPSKSQQQILFSQFDICKAIYNELLELSIKTYKEKGKTLREFDYNNYLSGKHPELLSQVRQNISKRVSEAFKNFFRRVKAPACREKGFPRFKSRVRSITYPQAITRGKRNGFWLASNKRLHASKIGNIPIVLHRVPRGKVKTLTIKRNNAGQWFAIFACELPDVAARHPSTEKIGIDVGLESFATLSNGETVANPRFLVKAEKRLKLLHRRLSRKKKGSHNGGKARFKLARQHIKVANQRTDFLHKLSNRLTVRFGSIAVEDLQVSNMLGNHRIARSISDASWSTFVRMLEYKAVTSGSSIVKVSPRNTSKACSGCGTINEMPLSKRQFNCSGCGLSCHRDLNASINILKVGTDYAELNACGDSASIAEQSATSGIVEAGTTLGNA